ncbi:BTAD domain-containing putative transcriptional regulator [Nonomuraea sp. NPDC003804]|uniref:BTAD domain-containing putative transcriptional regulator n=1 Tax=Nonomuraea sp. NPDC003804 TaxID=3154547 RepID=UPI0033B972D6
MRVAILGPLEVEGPEGPIEVGGARVRALLALLALEEGRLVTADRLIDALWPGEPPANAANALQTLVKRLRAALRPCEAVESRPGGYRLTARVDVRRFHDLVAAGELEAALKLWRGPALADLATVPHLANVAAALEEDRLAAVETRAEARLAAGLPVDLAAEVAAHPLRERLCSIAVRTMAAAGRQADALALFERTRARLADELGVDPGPELRAAHLAVVSGDLPAAPPTGRPPVQPTGPPAVRHRRPGVKRPLTSFIGREEELEELTGLLATSRMVSIVGPGGAGKTRLATEAALLAEEAWLVELAAITDPADVPGAVLDALDLRGTDRPALGAAEKVSPADRLVGALAGRKALIVLDNCEHLVAAAAVLAERLLIECPGLRVLATSREPLGVQGERLAAIPPLELPPEGAQPGVAAASPAVRLLLDRASGVRLDERNVAAIVAICRRLDGMPLAIELAAARLRTMTPAQLADRLDDRFRLLTGGSRTALPRQQTLRAVVEWSWDLLTEEERALAESFAVFPGGATLEAVEAVCGAGIEVLGALVDKSLVRMDAQGRYTMLETIRAYAMDGGRQPRRAHAVHFAELAEAAVPHLRTAEQLVWIERLAAERDNHAAALRWALDTGEVELALRLCGALTWYWWLCGYRAEGEAWATQVIELAERAGDGPPPGLAAAYAACTFGVGTRFIGRLLNEPDALGRILDDMERVIVQARAEGPVHPMLWLGRAVLAAMTRQEERLAELLDEYVAAEDPWLSSAALMIRGGWRSAHPLAEDDLERAVAGFRRIGDRWGLSESLLALAGARVIRGKPAAELIAEAGALTVGWVSVEDTITTLTTVALLRAQGGDAEGGAADLARARAVVSDETSPQVLLHLRLGEAELARLAGDGAAALARYEELLAALPAMSDVLPQQVSWARTSYGRALLEAGDPQGAREQLRLAVETFGAAPDLPILAAALAGFAQVALADGDAERAAVLLGGASAVHGGVGGGGAEMATTAADTRAALGDAAFEAAFGRGGRMSRDQLTRLA